MNSRKAIRRLGGTAVLLFFAAALFAPVYAALSLCAMPCCHHSAAPSSVAFPCCNVSASHGDDDVAAVAVPSSNDAAVVAPVAVIATTIDVPAAPQYDLTASVTSSLAHRPLHLVNSVFLI